MSTNPVPALSLPGLRDTSDQGIQRNFQQILLWSQTVSPRMYAVANSIGGSTSEITTPSSSYLMQIGHALPTFDGSGEATIDFGQPFLTHVSCIQLTVAEDSLGLCVAYDGTSIAGAGPFTGFTAILSQGDGTPITGGHAVDWTAIGF